MGGTVGEVVGQVVNRDRLAVVLAQEGRGTQGQGLLSGERPQRLREVSTADAHGHPRQSRRRRTCGDQHVRMSSRPTRMGPSFPVRAMDEEDKRFLPLGPAADPLTADMPHGWSTGRSNAARIRHVTERDSPGAVRPSARKCESEAVVMRTAGFLPTPQRWCSGLFILGIGDPALRPGKT